MKPILLDQRGIFRAGLSLSIGMLAVFFTGYYIGHQKADSGRSLGLNKTIALALPGPAHADTTEFEPKIPRVQIPGADIDVDSPQPGAAESAGEAQTTAHMDNAGAGIEAVINKTTDIIEKPDVSDGPTAQDDRTLQIASLDTSAGKSENGSGADVIENVQGIEPGASAEITDTATAENARYTIQVGVFADSENALRRMSELESRNLSAYTDGYTNSRDELRFNVRFGYFEDRSSALAALNRFQQTMSGSGYVTRIRRN